MEFLVIGTACLVVFGLVAWGRALSGEAEEDHKQVHGPHPPEDWYDRADKLTAPRPVDGTP